MKKNNLGVLIIALLCLFIGVKEVKADIKYYLNDGCANMSNGMGKTCNTKLIVEGGNVRVNEIKIDFILTGATFAKDEVSLNSGWTVSQISDTSITISSSKSTFAPGTYDIGTFNFYKIASASVCNVIYSYEFTLVNRICKVENGHYYDKNGEETDQLTYQKQCENNICKVLSDGTYFGKSGTEVTKDVYEQECEEKKYCQYSDGKYYDKDGNETTELNYKRICEKNYCKILSDGTNTYYYDKDGNEVNKETYEEDCLEIRKCVKDGDKYYDKDGKETTKLNYEKTCFKNVCKKLSDGTYYNSKGEETDELTYQKECEKNVCKVLSDGTYYDNNGKVVTKEEYEKACNTCKEENGKYYDKEGKETTKENFELVCKVHKCQVINNTYFDDKGNIVTKEVYDKYCTNPKTGNIVPYIYTFLGILTATGLFVYSKKHKKLNRI